MFLLLKTLPEHDTIIIEYKLYLFGALLGVTYIKCNFFIFLSLEHIAKTYTHNKSFHWFVKKIAIIFFLLVISFAIDNYIIFEIDKTSFTNAPNKGVIENGFEFLYYSFMTITTVGFGELKASSIITKLYSAIEVFIGLIFITYILSCFLSVREALIKDKPFNVDYEAEKAKQENSTNENS